MLSSMVKEHQARQQLRRDEQDRRRKEALQASTNLTNALVDHLNVGVAQAYLNQKRLDSEARRLEQSAAVLQKQTQNWITLVRGFCSALKQIGDVPSWTKAIHRDVATVAATMEMVYASTYSVSHPGTSQNFPGCAQANSATLSLPQASSSRSVSSTGSAESSSSSVEVKKKLSIAEGSNKLSSQIKSSPGPISKDTIEEADNESLSKDSVTLDVKK